MRDNWSQSPIQEVTSLIKDGTHATHKDVSNGIPMLSAKDIVGGKVLIPDDARLIPETDFLQIHKSYKLQENDVLLTLVGTIGRVALLRDYSTKFTFQRSVGILRFNDRINSLYAYYYISSESFLNDLIRSMNASAQGGVYLGELGKINISFPKNLPQQQKIAQILTTCDAVIEKTEAAIAKYQAIKQGLMHDLFTRGIDVNTSKLRPKQEDAPQLYKESELGWIPKDWKVTRLEELCYEKPKYGINAASVEFNSNLPTYLRITDIDENGNFSKTGRKSVDNPFSDQYYLKKGDIVFARTGATVGKTYLYNENDGELVYAGFLIKASPNKNILDSDFLKFLTETSYYLNWVVLMSQRSGQPGINGAEYGSLKVVTPNLTEQKIISERLLVALKKIQTEQSALSKYQQLKTGLMQDLLSGKVKVKV